MIRAAVGACGLALLSPAWQAAAHELRPAYLEIKEVRPDVFAVLWKVPARGERRLGLSLAVPATCEDKEEPVHTLEGGAHLERRLLACRGGIKRRVLAIDGLRTTLTDALVRIENLDGSIQIARLTPEAPSLIAAGAHTWGEVASAYFLLGVEHILEGLDHLLFVFALMLFISNPWMLVKTITAFTIAHSITLAGAALDYFSLPQAPVEAMIALSILFLANELIRPQPGVWRMSERYPWVIAFIFGLLHGLGFAGALKAIGLPQTDIPLALLTFNLGVEAGQLLFVGAVLLLWRASRLLVLAHSERARPVAAYAIGAVSAYWLISRLTAL